MPHALSLQIGSTTNIPLSTADSSPTTTGALLLDYVPQAAALSVTGQGVEVYASEKQLVTESVRLWLYAASGAALQAKIANIERFIENMTRRQSTRSGDRGYLYIQMSSDAEVWRSEIVSARLQMGDDTLRLWGNNGAEVMLIVTRRPFWETVDEVELPLDNSSAGGKATGGVTIYNHDDATTGHDNWVEVAAADVVGNLPAPLRLKITNTSGSTLLTNYFYQAVNAHFAPTTFAHVVEGEGAYGTSTVADANSSGTSGFGRASWVGAINHNLYLMGWTIANAKLIQTAGGFFRVLARFANTPPTGIELRLSVKADPPPALLTTLWQGPKMTATGNKLQDLGVLQLPPGASSQNHGDIGLLLTAEYGGTGQLDVDFLHFTPANSTRTIKQAGFELLAGDAVINDGSEKRVYMLKSATSTEFNIFESYDSALYVWPNQDQRIILLHDEGAAMVIARTWLVEAWYRPRRNTL